MLNKAEKNRNQIVNAASKLFYRQGYEYTSFTDIASESGIPRGNFYYYFKTKEDILDAVIGTRKDNFRKLLDSWNTEFATPLERLHRSLNMLKNSESEVIRYGCPMGTLNTELGKADHPHRDDARAMFDLFRDWLVEQFQALGRDDADQLAMHLLARTQGITVIAHTYRDPEFIHREAERLHQWLDSLVADYQQ
ncbi:MAG: TetR/AcrR family transcriptional regulator [Gammaproteobacteria bacterium]|nr:MAG: TetR/AcrR family transcriptional regulator [Gammaproteobacteria bacterium]